MRYEVASIKPSRSSEPALIQPTVRGTLRAENVTVRTFIEWAYSIEPFRLLGGPKWINEDRFNIQAKSPITHGYVSFEQNQQMMQALLQDRFKLVVHHETRKLAAYFLAVSRAGLKAPETRQGSCYVVTRETKPADVGNQLICGAMRGRIGDMEGAGISMGLLCKNLERMLGAVVLDKTGIGGRLFDISLRWMPEIEFNVHSPDSSRDSDTRASPETAELPSLVTALKEQLGLELESNKAPIDVLVIDHVERPDPN